MRVIVGFIVLVFVGALVDYWGRHSLEKRQELEIYSELSLSHTRSPSQSLAFAISVAADEELKSRGIKTQRPTTVENTLDTMKLTPHEEELWQILGNDAQSQRIRRALLAQQHVEDLPGAGRFLDDLYTEMRKDSQNSLTALQANLSRLPASEFSKERVAIQNMMEIVSAKR